MSAVGPIEWRKDILGERFYASRNYNDLQQTYNFPGTNRGVVDWNLTLRQQRKKMVVKDQTRSAPNLLMNDRLQERAKDPEPGHEHGPYHSETETMGKYQNYSGTVHLLQNLKRTSSGSSQMVDWQLNLRDGTHGKTDDKWRRHHTRPQQSFDMMAENCSNKNEQYQTSHVTPHDRRPDRRNGAISIETIRDDPISFRRNPGCEGTHVGQWEHLIQDRRYGHKARRQLGHETTLREHNNDPNGARISDTRSEGCIVEMLGKKKWIGHEAPDFLSAKPPTGDTKLYHLSRRRIQSEPDEENREKRMNKQSRTDANISYTHQGSFRKKAQDEEEDREYY